MKKLTDKQVIDRCVDIAIKNGWGSEVSIYAVEDMTKQVTLNGLLFDHDFCEALFGNSSDIVNGWMLYIQQLVIAEDRIDYLRDWLRYEQ